MRTILFAFLAIYPAAALANASDCHFKTPNAIVCTDGLAAVMAFRTYGSNIALTNQSNSRALLQQSGCGRAYGNNYLTVEIRQAAHGRVPMPDGWVGVTTIIVNDRDLYYVADSYLSGPCQKYKAPPPYVVRGLSEPSQ